MRQFSSGRAIQNFYQVVYLFQIDYFFLGPRIYHVKIPMSDLSLEAIANNRVVPALTPTSHSGQTIDTI